jgi:ATP-dependent RNA/DNA helicase IGHMBP2
MDAWVLKQRELLQLEKDAELDEAVEQIGQLSAKECEELGVSLLSLSVNDTSAGLYGRTVISLTKEGNPLLPAHSFSSGDIVALSSKASASEQLTGIVCKVTDGDISVAFDNDDAADELGVGEKALRLDKLANDASYRKIETTLQQLRKCDANGPAARLTNVLFGISPPERVAKPFEFEPFNRNLNDSQLRAISFALSTKDVALIQGPPGTGKTTTVVELVRQAVNMKMRVLLCAPSNVAVDNIVERLAHKVKGSNPRFVRLGHPARVMATAQAHTLDAIVQKSDGTQLVGDIRQELKVLQQKCFGGSGKRFGGGNSSNKRMGKAEYKASRGEIKLVRSVVGSTFVESSFVGSASSPHLCVSTVLYAPSHLSPHLPTLLSTLLYAAKEGAAHSRGAHCEGGGGESRCYIVH